MTQGACLYAGCPLKKQRKIKMNEVHPPAGHIAEVLTAKGENEKWDRIHEGLGILQNDPLGREAQEAYAKTHPNLSRMNQADYFAFHEKFCANALDLSKKKNNDYTGSGGTRPFANFEQVEALGICSTERGFLTRLTDKLCRVTTYVNDEKLLVEDESVRDTLIDIVNYTVLLAAYIEDKRGWKDG